MKARQGARWGAAVSSALILAIRDRPGTRRAVAQVEKLKGYDREA